MSNFLDEYGQILRKCERPSRYIGSEYLSVAKPFESADVRFLLAFADKYEIGISNFGFKILYHILNSNPDFTADRLYAPDKDFLNELSAHNKELYSLELKKPVKSFDIIGFGLQYELSYTTVLKMLEAASIPVFSKERDNTHPIIAAGGPCAYNPVAMADFIDLFFIGDGEELVSEVCAKYKELKAQKTPRDTLLQELSKIEGVYCPKYSKTVKKRVSPLNVEFAPTASPMPHFVSVHDRATVEIRRGCARLCRFCQSAHTNLPIRERKKEEVIPLVLEYVKNTGYDEYSLLSLSSNDHSEIEAIIETLNARFKGSGVNVSLPSQRADNFSLKLATLMSEVKKSTVTLAPEAGSRRMREVIKKNLTQEQIINAVLSCVKEGWQRVKLYFMIGLPTEEREDLDAIITLLAEINMAIKSNGLRLPAITCSVSIFVPKPFTPFQWHGQDSLEMIWEKINHMKGKLREGGRALKNVKLNFHNPKLSQIEALFSRADEAVAKLVYSLYKQGAYLESWDENFSYENYVETAKTLGFDIEKKTTQTLETAAALGWDMIDAGIEKAWLIKEYEAALSASCTSAETL